MSQFDAEETFCLNFSRIFYPVADDENINVDCIPDFINGAVLQSQRLLDNGWIPNFLLIVCKPDNLGCSKKIILWYEQKKSIQLF